MKIIKNQKVKIVFVNSVLEMTVKKITKESGVTWFYLKDGSIDKIFTAENLKKAMVDAETFEELTEVEI